MFETYAKLSIFFLIINNSLRIIFRKRMDRNCKKIVSNYNIKSEISSTLKLVAFDLIPVLREIDLFVQIILIFGSSKDLNMLKSIYDRGKANE